MKPREDVIQAWLTIRANARAYPALPACTAAEERIVDRLEKKLVDDKWLARIRERNRRKKP